MQFCITKLIITYFPPPWWLASYPIPLPLHSRYQPLKQFRFLWQRLTRKCVYFTYLLSKMQGSLILLATRPGSDCRGDINHGADLLVLRIITVKNLSPRYIVWCQVVVSRIVSFQFWNSNKHVRMVLFDWFVIYLKYHLCTIYTQQKSTKQLLLILVVIIFSSLR